MAELLLGEMMREWRFGNGEVGTEEEEKLRSSKKAEEDDGNEEERGGKGKEIGKTDVKRNRGNERVKPDVVTFTAV